MKPEPIRLSVTKRGKEVNAFVFTHIIDNRYYCARMLCTLEKPRTEYGLYHIWKGHPFTPHGKQWPRGCGHTPEDAYRAMQRLNARLRAGRAEGHDAPHSGDVSRKEGI